MSLLRNGLGVLRLRLAHVLDLCTLFAHEPIFSSHFCKIGTTHCTNDFYCIACGGSIFARSIECIFYYFAEFWVGYSVSRIKLDIMPASAGPVNHLVA